MATDPSAFLQIVDGLLRAGDVRKARRALERLAPARLPRAELATVAALARRAQWPELALRLLGPLVRGKARGALGVTPREVAEYADALTRLGALEEATFRLEHVDPREVPEALPFLASARIAQWNYEDAAEPLERFLALSDDAYARLVARLNLATTLIDRRHHDEAERLLDAVRDDARKGRWTRVYGNALEASAGNAVWAGRWREAEAFLREAERALGPSARKEALFVDKWRALLMLRRDGATAEARRRLAAVRRTAARLRHGETARDCDRHEALVTGDTALAARVFHGSPFPAFRRRFRDDWGERGPLGDSYDWIPGDTFSGDTLPAARAKRRVLTLATGRIDDKAGPWTSGGVSGRLLAALCADLYRPARMGGLFARTFPDQYFDAETSPGRVHQAMRRLRGELRAARYALSIDEEDGAYRVIAKGPVVVRLGEVARDRPDALLQKLRARWPHDSFTARDATETSGAHLRVVQRALRRACEEGALERSGFGAASRYRFR